MHLQERVVSNDTFRIFISGNANLVSFVDYLAGRRTGIYWPVLPPTYQKENNQTNNKVDYLNTMSEEAWILFNKATGLVAVVSSAKPLSIEVACLI